MAQSKSYRLPLLSGPQYIRLDKDSLDYRFEGYAQKFSGTLPYENLRPFQRVTRKNQSLGLLALFVGLAFLACVPLFPRGLAPVFATWMGPAFAFSVGGFVTQLVAGGQISVQINPPPFGFSSELPIPDTKAGRAFLDDLVVAWKKSLVEQFRASGEGSPNRRGQIDWMEAVGAFSAEEAAIERAATGITERRLGNSTVPVFN